MKYYIIAGEASGDLHGSTLIRELKKIDQRASIRCWGGDLMQAAGGQLVKHYKDLAFMGFSEVIRNLPTIFENLRLCKKDILEFQPDCLILIDYPGFNLRMAKWARARGFKVIYYISPQVWAWKENRVRTIQACVHKMLVILPFEKDFYKKWNYEVDYVGHPLVEVIENYRSSPAAHKLDWPWEDQGKDLVALLPGSRKQEILKKLPIMLEMSKRFPDTHFAVAMAPGVEDEFYQHLLKDYPGVFPVKNRTYDLLMAAQAACVTSGTATLETALFGVPEVICYKGSSISYQIARKLIKVKYISLVNLIMDKPVVKELIQKDLNPGLLEKELSSLLKDPDRRQKIQADYANLKALLTLGGKASANAAKIIVQDLQGQALVADQKNH